MVKVAEGNGNYFGVADHGKEVIITDGGVLKSNKGSDYLQLEYELDGKEGDTGYNNYLTEKALPYTAQRIQSIFTHNAKDEADADKRRAAIAEVDDDAFGEWALERLVGMKAYLNVNYSDNINPKSGKPYLEFNVQGYAPQPLAEPVQTTAQKVMDGGTPVSTSNIPF